MLRKATDSWMPALIEPETNRLLLRQWREEDLAPFAQLNGDATVMRYFPKTLTRSESDALAIKLQHRIAEQGWGFWAVELRDTGAFMGFVGLNRPDYALPIGPCVEIGWRMLQEYWGFGYATEAAQAALRVGFETLGLDEIVSYTATINLPSQRVMQRLGMQLDRDTFEHPLVPEGHPLRTHVVYRLTQQQWQESHE
ncbi:GNAT family N-acetyltransferase [Aeoliella mucimassa]|uniref:N-acetyltransferase domain-containing protein n=1 Tax=Aeoliella mucimassa TaxID=2527972 RepID=A0A518AHU6_9BACT|nr:GNAT family N-acetyltransferase [Aeoliella mucimassa]QDU54297.1 hypothetical protein Pan181_04780 [Aeoliella mucimassa]